MSQENFENKKTSILEAAYVCISQKGYANVTLREISKEAKIALSQLNYYFVNKEGLFIEIFRFLSNKYIEKLDGYLINSNGENNILYHVNKFVEETYNNDPGVFRILFDIVSMALWSDNLKVIISGLFEDMVLVINKHIHEIDDLNSTDQETMNYAKFILSSSLGTILLSIFSIDCKYDFDVLSKLYLVGSK